MEQQALFVEGMTETDWRLPGAIQRAIEGDNNARV